MPYKITAIARGAAIAALYAALTLIFQPFSFGPYQIRVSEALTLTPVLWAEAVPGLFIGCFIANIFGGYGPWDIFLGSAATLIAALITRKAKNDFLAALSPVAVNAAAVGLYMSYLTGMPLTLWIPNVALGEAIACFVIGLPLLRLARKIKEPHAK